MSVLTRCFIGALSLAGVAACAVSPSSPSASEPQPTSAELGDNAGQSRYVTVTGSRIRYRVDAGSQAPLTSFPVVDYGQDDVEFTGAQDMQGALMILDPRID